jgi:uncharacterized protein
MSMQFDLSGVREAAVHLDRTYAPGQFPRDELYEVATPVHLVADVRRDGQRFHVVGRVTGELELACSRCLEPFRVPVDAPFDLRYLPHAQNSGEGEQEIEEDDLNTAFYHDDVLDLGDLIREQFYLALPMKPLCRDECRGLCPRCGTNLNTGTCECRSRWEDPRLSPLRGLLARDTEP